MSLSKNQRKFITSLAQKKYRQSHKLFIAEGVKVVEEFLNSNYQLHSIYATDEYESNLDIVRVSESDLQKISQLKSANKVLAVFHMNEKITDNKEGLMLALDAINDPGNLGTIIRLCDWFGVSEIICSEDTVDCYNLKVVQASMGSLTRVNIVYTNLIEFLKTSTKPLFVADMNGENIYQQTLPKDAILIMGNEANGISKEVFELASHKISIPRFGKLQETESLNVATATAIILSEFKR